MTNVGSIEAVLSLNAGNFTEGLKSATSALNKFANATSKLNQANSTKAMQGLNSALDQLESTFISLEGVSDKNLATFSKLSNAINNMAKGLKTLQSDSISVEEAVNTMNSIFKQFEGVLGGTVVEVKGLTTALRELNAMENQEVSSARRSNSAENERINTLRRLQKELNIVALGIEKFNAIDSTSNSVKRLQAQIKAMEIEFNSAEKWMMDFANKGVEAFNRIGRSVSSVVAKTNTLKLSNTFNNPFDSGDKLAQANALIHQNSQAMRENGAEILRNMGYRGRLSIEEEKQTASNEKNTNSNYRNSRSMNSQANASRGLGRALSSLKMMGTMVASMFAYNFAHNLMMATSETVHAKSEMEGYFKMLHYSQDQVNDFNKSLEETVHLFPRLNKYALGETISSIGVEFELTTQEMEKAMPVVSMITSEYLRAGRNVNEASLAVKDILQGEFQRLSRETGVKEDTLKEAGWNGDKNDVMGLLEALDKVGKSRNWDQFVTKANSLNDIILILQNRFGEWSADMVNVVQPSIVGAFNSIMSFGQGLAQSLSRLWKWLNGGSWGAIASQIGLVSSAILILMPSLVAWRTGSSLLEVANMGLSRSLTGLVLGINAETLATNTASESIAMKILSLEAEEVAEFGLMNVVRARVLGIQAESLSTELATAGNYGFVGSLYALVTGETLAEAQTIGLSGAIALLTGAFLTSPIGWFTLAILGLASAFYVLTGGLSDSWDKMKQFNEIMKNPHDSIKPYKDEVTRLNGEIEKASEKYGEDSEQVKKLHKELDDAQASLDNATHSVEHGVYWNNEYKKSFEGIDAELDKITRNKLGDLGVSDEEIDKISELSDVINTGVDKQYHALQVLHKQQSDYGDGVDELSKKLDHAHIKGDEATESLAKFKGNTDNLITHSAIANSSDDWWEWLWNSFYAGMDQFWINWDNFWLEVRDSFINWDFLSDEGKSNLKSITDFFGGIWDGLNSSLGDWQKGATEFLKPLDDFGNEVNKFLEDPLGYLHIDLSGLDFFGKLFEGLFDEGGGETGGFMKKIDISSLLQGLFSLGDGLDFTWAIEWVNTNIISPISQTLMMFVGDPVSFIGNLGFSVSGLLDGLFGTDIFTNIWTWTNTNIIAPIGNAIWSGISQIPIVGDIVALLGLLSDENIGAGEKGRAIANWIGNGITSAIGQIPIIGDIARMLGLIPQQEPNAQGKGKGIGDSIKDGVMNGLNNLGSQVIQEFNDALNGIGQLGQQAFDTAKGWADQLWQGVNSILQRASPGFFHDQFQLEFGQDIPNAITEAGSTAYTVAQAYGQSIKDGISETSFNTTGFDSAVGIYQDDAQIVADSSQLMGTTTTDAFNSMTMSVNQTTSMMSGNVATTYTGMQQKQQSSLNTMRNQNLQAYNDMYLKSNQSLIQMRDSTSNVTHQMTNAWTHMKDQIVASANKLKSDSTSHFNQLSNTIGGFYRKIQNPSNWGAGHGTPNIRGARNSTAGRGFARTITRGARHGAGSSSLYNGREEMTIASLKRLICPNGQCDNLFDGYSMSDKVNVQDFISSITGEHGFGWGDWNGTHYNYIRTTSNAWGMKSPVINLAGGIPTNSNFKVGDFEKGTPNISFGSFVSMAESIFSRIPYKYYYDSAWKGSWLGALQAGACNCSDGADALIAFAQACNPNWSVSKQHGHWGKDGHFWAVINGKVMDTTAWQGGYGWTSPKVSGYGSPYVRRANPSRDETQSGKTVNVNVEISGTVYGVDDLDSKIQESVQKGLQKEFNDPYTVAI